jgi:zinc D-Ala-D-Ala carboxypeptidase
MAKLRFLTCVTCLTILTGVVAQAPPAGIKQSVGEKGVNQPDDVKAVQAMLNKVPPEKGGPAKDLKVDGKVEPQMVEAIRRFQKVQLKQEQPDGRVDPGGPTLAGLQKFSGQPDPKGGGGDSKPDDVAALAAKIRDSKRIELLNFHISKVKDQATAKQNIADTAAGKKAQRSSYGNAPGGSVALKPSMLKGMLELSETFSFRVTEIAGGSHSPKSLHYTGGTFDVDMINGKPVNASNPHVKAFMKECRDLGADEVLGPGAPGHDTHIHAAWK